MNPENFKTMCGLIEDAGAALFMLAIIWMFFHFATKK